MLHDKLKVKDPEATDEAWLTMYNTISGGDTYQYPKALNVNLCLR